MKKALFSVLLVLLFAGCNGGSNKESMQHEIDSLQEQLGTYKSKYGELTTDDAQSGKFGIWEKDYFVDDFGERTNQAFVYTKTIGTFSNSATTDSKLGVVIMVLKSRFAILLYEYAGNHLATDTGFMSYKIKRSDGKSMSFKTLNDKGHNIVYGDEIAQDNPKTVQELMDFLNTGGEVVFVGESSNSKYKFKLTDTSHLRKALESL